MKKVVGWTCTCQVRQAREIIKETQDSEVIKTTLIEMGKLLHKNKNEVECRETYWNHDTDGKPVKIEIEGNEIKEVSKSI